jgi:2-phosphosulfolactate phosphatase
MTITQTPDRIPATGTVVVIDVLRAFTTVCYLYDRGAARVIACKNLAEAYALKRDHPTYRLAGERGGLRPDGFDWGNSPAELKTAGLRGQTVVLTTSAGTAGLVTAISRENVITGAFVNASAVAAYLKRTKPRVVTFYCTDNRYPDNEDVACARYIRSLVLGRPMRFDLMRKRIAAQPTADGFLRHPLTRWAKEDFDLSLRLDTFDFVVGAKKGTPIQLIRL